MGVPVLDQSSGFDVALQALIMPLRTRLDFIQTPLRVIILLIEFDLLGDYARESIIGELWL